MITLTFKLIDDEGIDIVEKQFDTEEAANSYQEGFLLNRKHMQDIGVTIEVERTTT